MADPYDWDAHGFAKPPFRLPTQRAAAVVFEAAEVARRSGAEDVTPDHLLLALASQPESMAARILDRTGVSLDAIPGSLASRTAIRQSSTSPEKLLLSPAAKQVIDSAYEEARRLDNLFVGVEHLLMGLLSVESMARDTLLELGITVERLRQEAHAMKWG